MNHGWIYHDRIAPKHQDWTLLDYYTQQYQHSSRAEWQQRIEQGQVLLNDRPVPAQTLLQPGDRLAYHRPPWQEPAVPLTFEVLYADADLMVVAKPAGLPVLPGGGFLEHTLLRQLQHRYPHETPMPIHRLGRGTSGLLLLARSPQSRAVLSQQMRDRQMTKIYRALATGQVPDAVTITQPIGKVPHPVLGHLFAACEDGSPAHSQVFVRHRHPDTTLIDVHILTGRPHQIRIHLASIGHPLVGDPLYAVGGGPLTCTVAEDGELPVPGDCGYHLHAMHLHFTHPNGQRMQFTCPPPFLLQDATDFENQFLRPA